MTIVTTTDVSMLNLAQSIATAAYIVAALLFILALSGLSKQETARRGVVYGIAGMTIALAATVVLVVTTGALTGGAALGVALLVGAVVIGGAIGLWRARVVEMTGMPELIALLHSFVGLAAVAVLLASINIFGGFAVTRRMLAMFQKGDQK